MAGAFGAASIPFVACVSLLVAMVLQIVAFASPYWAEEEGTLDEGDKDFGLWRWHECEDLDREINGDTQEGCWEWEQTWDVDDWLVAVRGLESLTIIFWSIPLVVVPVYIYVALGLYYVCMMTFMMVVTLLGAVTNIIGVVVFALEIEDDSTLDVGWCLIVCAVAFLPGFIAFIAFLVAAFNRPKFLPERHYTSDFYVDPDRNRMYVVEVEEPPKSMIGGPNSVRNGGVDNRAMVVD